MMGEEDHPLPPDAASLMLARFLPDTALREAEMLGEIFRRDMVRERKRHDRSYTATPLRRTRPVPLALAATAAYATPMRVLLVAVMVQRLFVASQ